MAKTKYLALLMTVGVAVTLSACADRTAQNSSPTASVKPTAVWTKKRPAMQASLTERDCLARAMYFESNRASPDGMLAVGSVVMNRYESGRFGNSICSVVGAPRQFAPGVLSRAMSDRSAPVARGVADAVLSGQRHAQVGSAMHFHMAGLRFNYPNMHYVTVAGGNAFYEKRDRYFYGASPVMTASAEPVQPVQSVAFNQQDDNARFGAVITDMNATPARAEPAMLAEAAPARVAPVVAAAPAVNSPVVMEKPAVAALMAPTPLPPRRPKMLGQTTAPDKQASLGTTLRVADSGIR